MNKGKITIDIRKAISADSAAIVSLDAEITGTEKPAYWSEILERYSSQTPHKQRHFLVSIAPDAQLVGFIVGEIRAWEFGSPPCGWVLAMSVSPQHREHGIGARMLDALCVKLKRADIATIRTMVLRSDKVNLSFFRGEGLTAGPYIELEKRLD